MMARMKLEEEREEAQHTEGNPHSSPVAGKQDKATTTSSVNPYNQSPTMSKRKFLKTQGYSQITTDAAVSDNTQHTKASLDNKASQDQ
jgi:hypothetical protein